MVVASYNPDAPGVTKAAENLSQVAGYHTNVMKGVERLRELQPKGDSSGWLSKETSPQYRRFDAARNELFADLLLAKSGKAVTDDEFKRYRDMLQDNKRWQIGNNNGLFDEIEAASRRNMNAAFAGEQAAGNIRVLRGDEQVDPRFGAQGRYMPYEGDLDPHGAAVDNADLHGGDPVKTPAADDVDLANAKSAKPHAPSALWNQLTGGDSKYV